MGHKKRFGARSLGRLQFRTAEEARGAARDLGLTGVHSHTQNGERVWMPGRNHNTLSNALKRKGLPPAPKPGMATDGMMSGTGGEMLTDGMMQGDRSNGDVVPSITESTEASGLGRATGRGESAADVVPDVSDAEMDRSDAGGIVTDDLVTMGDDRSAVDRDRLDDVMAEDLAGLFVGDEDDDNEMEI